MSTTAGSTARYSAARYAPEGGVTLVDAVCRRGRTFHLGPVDLHVEPGAVCGVGGVNGAGKTTLLRVAAGLLPLASGSRVADGRVLYLRSGAGARGGQRVAEAVASAAALAGHRADPVRILEEVDLAGMTRRRVRALSMGERARLTLAVACAVHPDVVCLDEPFAHVDRAGADAVRSVITRLAAAGAAVLVTSPRRDDLGVVADAVLVVAGGTVSVA
jgi:ABC-2 type transport system ATP-binding protein